MVLIQQVELALQLVSYLKEVIAELDSKLLKGVHQAQFTLNLNLFIYISNIR